MGFLIKKLMQYFTALTAAQPHRSSFSFHGCWMCLGCSWHLLPFQHYKSSSCERFVSNSNDKCPLCAQTEGAIDTHGSCEGIFTNILIDFQFMPQSSLERARWFSKQITRTSTQPCLVGGFFLSWIQRWTWIWLEVFWAGTVATVRWWLCEASVCLVARQRIIAGARRGLRRLKL